MSFIWNTLLQKFLIFLTTGHMETVDFSLENSISVQRKDEAHFMSLLKVAEATPGLYFSYDTDLTLKYVRQFCSLFMQLHYYHPRQYVMFEA